MPLHVDQMTEADIARLLSSPSHNHIQHDLESTRVSNKGNLRPAAVLVPFIRKDGHWQILLTRRTDTVQSHKGQVSFPGGASEPGDASPEETAQREAYEEIGIYPEHVRVLGRLDAMETVTGFLVQPIVAKIPWPYPLRISSVEVSRVFTIPLEWLAEAANREERPHEFLGRSGMVVYYQLYDGELLWGATARMIVNLLNKLKLIKE